MTYNTDTFGNGYWNSRAGGGLGVVYSTANLLTALETFWGSGRSSISSPTGGILSTHMNYPGEITVGSGSPTTFSRFGLYIGTDALTTNNSISTSNATGLSRAPVSVTAARSAIPTPAYMYCNFRDRNFNILITNSSFSQYRFASSGYFVDNAGYTMTHEQLYGCYAIAIENNSILFAFRPGESNTVNGNSWRPLLTTGGTAQYSITCASGSVSGTHRATDLWLIDQNAPSIKGKIANLLLLKSPAVIGQLYNVSDNVDGNTAQKVFMCCAAYGSDSILMRVHT